SLNSEIGSPTAAYDWIGAYTNGFQNSPLRQWLIQDLEQNTLPWVIVFWHQPPFSKGSHDSDKAWEIYMKAMRQNIVPVLEQYGVDMVVNGHSHNYERSYLIKGHTGLSNTFNPQQHIVNGKSGNPDLGEAYIKYTDGPNKNRGTVYVISGNGGSQASDPPFNEGKPHPAMFYWDGGDGVHGSFVFEVDGNVLTGRYLTAEGEIKDKFAIVKQSSTASGVNDNPIPRNVSDIRVVPNPFSQNAVLNFNLSEQTNLRIELFSIDGRRNLLLADRLFDAGPQQVEINALQLHLAKGEYIIRISEEKYATLERIVKFD
ncbi:MAG: metallophosphoesterase, partial [Chitinophagales bacterium]|nr:metallophosphoesterase [Chitinophagales bacterium]